MIITKHSTVAAELKCWERNMKVTLAMVLLIAGTLAAVEPPNQEWFPKAPKLPPPTGKVLRVSTVDELLSAAEQVEPGGTILLADGVYSMPRYFDIHTDNVTLRSESGDRHRVVIDGSQSRHGELIGVTACSGVTIADLTVQNIKW